MTVRDILPWRKNEEERVERREELKNLTDFQREMNRLMESFFGDTELDLPFRSGFAPLVDVTETETALEIKADLPGMDERDVEVTLDENQLVLKGEKREEKEDKRKGIYRIERNFGSFYRRIPIPVEIEADQVSATFERGVLKITLPKREGQNGRGIKINVK